jgi:hypothetical protein
MGLDMGGSSAGDGSVATVTNRRRLDIAADRRARSTPLGHGEQGCFSSTSVGVDADRPAMTASTIVTLP